MLTLCCIFLLTMKVVQDASPQTLSSLFRAPKSRGGQNESPPNDPFSVENVFYFCHLGKKLIVDLGFPKYRWGTVVHSVSQVFAFICLKGTACVTCQLFRKV